MKFLSSEGKQRAMKKFNALAKWYSKAFDNAQHHNQSGEKRKKCKGCEKLSLPGESRCVYHKKRDKFTWMLKHGKDPKLREEAAEGLKKMDDENEKRYAETETTLVTLEEKVAFARERRPPKKRRYRPVNPLELNGNGDRTCSRCSMSQPKQHFFKSSATRCKECCRQSQITRYQTLRGFMQTLLGNARGSCKQRGHPKPTITLDLLFDQLLLQDGKCFYSGMTMVWTRYTSFQMSLERLDPNTGYTPENSVLIILELNTAAQWSKAIFDRVPALMQMPDDPNFQQNADKEWIPKKKGPKGVALWPVKEAHKICSRCHMQKAKTAFGLESSKKDKCRNICRECVKKDELTLRFIFNWMANRAKRTVATRNKINAKRKGKMRREKHHCDISRDHLFSLWKKQKGRCHYSNIHMQRSGHFKVSLERLDPFQGYVKSNVVLICKCFNSIDNRRKCRDVEVLTDRDGTSWSREKVQRVWGVIGSVL